MKKTHIIALSVAAIVIIILSITLGFQSVKENNDYSKASPTPHTTPHAEQAISSTTIPEPEGKYKIILKGRDLEMYEDEILIRKTEISPDVFPRADIKALTQGVSYASFEKALTDWESLCN